MDMEERYADDIRVVNEHMRQIAARAATTALADAIRSQGGLAAGVPAPLATSTGLVPRQQDYAAETHRGVVTVHPVPLSRTPTRWRWGVIEWCIAIAILAVGATAVLAIMAVARAIIRAAGLTGQAVAEAIPGLTGVAGLVVLGIFAVFLLGRGGGGTFSGTFTGSMD